MFISIKIYPQKFKALSSAEKKWSLCHPISALKIKKIYKKCLPIYKNVANEKLLDSFSNGGKLDAFRHFFFMAAFSQKIKSKKLRNLGIAHEKGNYKDFLKGKNEDGEIPDSLSTVMDLLNNDSGIAFGIKNNKKTPEELKLFILEEIKKGNAFYFKRDFLGRYLTCDNAVIAIENYKKVWFVPKCLVTTD